MKKLRDLFLSQVIDKAWYPVFVFFLIVADLFIMVVPLNLLSLSLLIKREKKWLHLVFFVTLASSLGAALLISLLKWNQEWVFQQFPSLFQSHSWEKIGSFLAQYGEWTVLIGVSLQFPLTPFVVVPTLAGTSPFKVLVFFVIGNFFKNLIVLGGARSLVTTYRKILEKRKSRS